MNQFVQTQIESIVRSLEEKGQAAAPVQESMDLATTHPEAISDLAKVVMQRFPKGGTFLDGAFNYLPQDDWPLLVRHALEVVEQSAGENEAAASVIAYASLQALSALRPHLSRIFHVRPNKGRYYESYPWRESGEQHFDYLRSVVESTSLKEEDRRRAWVAMLQTRHPKVIDFALSRGDLASLPPRTWSPEAWVQIHLALVGVRQDGDSLVRICPDSLYHLQFPEAFFETQSRPPWLARIHPTWRLPSATQAVVFGGESENNCSLCAGKLHRLLAFDPIPEGLGITGLPRLELASCLSCLGWERQPLFYHHDQNGRPENIGYDGPGVTPQFPAGPLRSAEVRLAETPRRWYWQDWGLSNSRENLNRIGGEPCWNQNAEFPNCPSCHRLMPYFMQLDSDLPMTEKGSEWLWGSGGIGYGFWCDHCKVSGFFWQCA